MRLALPGPLAGLADARLLVWSALAALVTGTALFFWPGDAPAWVDAAHSASTLLVLAGAAAHLVARLGRKSAARHVRSGGWALASVGFAAASGVLMVESGGDWAAAMMLPWGETTRLWAGVVHLAYATMLVLAAVTFHVAHLGWSRVVGRWGHLWASVALTAGATVAALALAGDPWVSTWIAVPPVPVLWAWSLLLGAGTALLAGRLTRRAA